MPLIKKSCIEEIKAKVNIYDLVSGYVSLKKSGSSYKGLSPFSHEKTPSFFVHPDKNFFYCFSTGQGGDIFKFVQLKEGLNFAESAEFIAARFGIPIEYDTARGGAAQNSSVKKQIFDINELAAEWYAKNFWADNPTAEEIRRYWTQDRKFSLDDAKNLRIGFSPLNDSAMKTGLQRRGFSPEAVKKCGLFFAKDADFDAFNLLSRFRGRLMIPIADVQGRTIGFTARKTSFTPTDIAYEEGKYVNSPETEIFKKNAVLFNLDRARRAIGTLGYAIVVEGQIDTMRMFCSGFENTVASQGTALGEEHLAVLKRYTDTVVLLFDGDAAGAKAALSKIPLFMKAGLAPFIVRLPAGDDPDTFIVKNGAKAMEEVLSKGRESPVKFMVEEMSGGGIGALSPMKKDALVRNIFESLAPCPSAIALDGYIEELARDTLSDIRAVKSDFAAWRKKTRTFQREDNKESRRKNVGETSRKMLTNASYDALIVCLNYENVAEALAEVIEDEWLNPEDPCEDALRRILVLYREGIGFDISEMDAHLESEAERDIVYRAYGEDKAYISNPAEAANDCVKKIYSKYCQKTIDDMIKRLDDPALDTEGKRRVLSGIKVLRIRAKTPPKTIISQTISD